MHVIQDSGKLHVRAKVPGVVINTGVILILMPCQIAANQRDVAEAVPPKRAGVLKDRLDNGVRVVEGILSDITSVIQDEFNWKAICGWFPVAIQVTRSKPAGIPPAERLLQFLCIPSPEWPDNCKAACCAACRCIACT